MYIDYQDFIVIGYYLFHQQQFNFYFNLTDQFKSTQNNTYTTWISHQKTKQTSIKQKVKLASHIRQITESMSYFKNRIKCFKYDKTAKTYTYSL